MYRVSVILPQRGLVHTFLHSITTWTLISIFTRSDGIFNAIIIHFCTWQPVYWSDRLFLTSMWRDMMSDYSLLSNLVNFSIKNFPFFFCWLPAEKWQEIHSQRLTQCAVSPTVKWQKKTYAHTHSLTQCINKYTNTFVQYTCSHGWHNNSRRRKMWGEKKIVKPLTSIDSVSTHKAGTLQTVHHTA